MSDTTLRRDCPRGSAGARRSSMPEAPLPAITRPPTQLFPRAELSPVAIDPGNGGSGEREDVKPSNEVVGYSPMRGGCVHNPGSGYAWGMREIHMRSRIAWTVMIALFSAAAAGLLTGPHPHTAMHTVPIPENGSTPTVSTKFTSAPPPGGYPDRTARDTAPIAAQPPRTPPATALVAWILLPLVVGAAAIGAIFFAPAPENDRGPRVHGTLGAIRTGMEFRRRLFVQRARRGLGHLHQELQVVLALLEPIEQQIDRLMRIQPGQHPTQFVQYSGLVRAQ